ncbi:MAG: PAS domain S-box protein, partial [Calditrichia bacterium]
MPGYNKNTDDSPFHELKYLELQFTLGRALAAAENMKEVADAILEAAISIGEVDSGGVYILNEYNNNLELLAYSGLPDSFIKKVSSYPPDSPNMDLVKGGKPIYSTFSELSPLARISKIGQELKGLAVVPVIHQNRIIAILNLASHESPTFTKQTQRIIEELAAQLSNNLARILAEQKSWNMASQLDVFFSNTQDSIFFMTMEQPIESGTPFINSKKAMNLFWENQRITRVNESILKQYNCSRQDLIGLKAADFYRLDQMQYREIWESLLSKGKIHIEFSTLKFDNTPMWIEGEYACLYDSQGRITGHFGVQREITKRKMAHEALLKKTTNLETLIQKRTEDLKKTNFLLKKEIQERKQAQQDSELKETAIETSINGVIFVKTTGKITYVNRSFLKIWGAKKDSDILIRNFKDLWADPKLAAEILKIVSKEYSWIGEMQAKNLNGSSFDVQIAASLIRTSRKNAKLLMFSVIDITTRTRAEKALRENEEKYRFMIEQHGEGIGLVDQDECFKYINKVGAEIFGETPETLTGRCLKDYVSAVEWQYILKQSEKRRSGKKSSYTIEVQRSDGEKRNLLITATPDYDSRRNYRGAIAILRDDTERISAEQQLRDSEEKFRTIYEHAPIMICSFDNHGNCLLWNRECTKHLGWSFTEINKNKNPLKMVFPSRQEQISVKKLIRQHSGKFHEFKVNAKNGDSRVQLWAVFDMPMQNLIMMGYDITERKRAEEDIKNRLENEEVLNLISSQFITEEDIHTAVKKTLSIITRFCKKSQAFVFHTSEDGKTLQCLYWHSENNFKLEKSLQSLQRSQFPQLFKYLQQQHILHIDKLNLFPGSMKEELKIWNQLPFGNLLIIPFFRGKFLAGFFGIADEKDLLSLEVHHISLLRLVAEIGGNAIERNFMENQLKESLRQNEALLEAMPDLMFVFSRKGKFLSFKAHETDILAIPPDDIIGKNISDVGFSGNDLKQFRKAMEDAFFLGTTQSLTYELNTPKGRRIFEARLSAVDKERILANVRDITKMRRMEEEQQKWEKLESLGVLAGGIAHDFNNVLTGILGNISLAMISPKDPEKTIPRLEAAEKAAYRARNLTQQLLTFSKGGLPVKQQIALKNLIEEAANFALMGSNVRCDCRIPADLPQIDADEGQITQVLHNLIINADQAMPNGGIIRIKCSKTTITDAQFIPLKPGEYVCIAIMDEGTGISPEFLPSIFDPYFTTKQKGSGLGLATSYSIIKKHEGYIGVESEFGKGTTFTIYLPVSTETEIQQRIEHKNGYKGSGRILIMDDDEMIRDITAATLHEMGYQTESVADGQSALERYRRAMHNNQPFDLVIMDLTIPGGMGGKEAIQKLLKMDPEAKTIVSSGYST